MGTCIIHCCRHMHEHEEIRFTLSGSCFFDIRGALKRFECQLSTAEECVRTDYPSDKWIRVHVLPGDLLVLPAGIYHRFSHDELDQVETLRLFKVRNFFVLLLSPKAVDSFRMRNQSGSPLHAVQGPSPKSIAFSTSIHSRLLQWYKHDVHGVPVVGCFFRYR